MGNPSFSLRLTLVLSLSIATATSSSPQPSLFFQSSSPCPKPKATPGDLLSVLGPTKPKNTTVNPLVAQQLKSCFKFLVPFSPPNPFLHSSEFDFPSHNRCSFTQRKLKLASKEDGDEEEEERENQLVWWPPKPVLELARLAIDSGGDPGAIHRALDPAIIPVPDVEGSKENRCELTRTPYGRRFISEELNSYLEFLFKLIVARGPSIGLNVSLNRYDLFHGHLFIVTDTGRLGILFHAREYPAYDKEGFPCYMGYCQTGSNVTYDESMNLRNILWLAPLPSNSTEAWTAPGVLVVLDARPDGIIYKDIIPEYVQFARTIYEDDLGEVVVDVNYLNVGCADHNYQIFIC